MVRCFTCFGAHTEFLHSEPVIVLSVHLVADTRRRVECCPEAMFVEIGGAR